MKIEYLSTYLPQTCKQMAEFARKEVRNRSTLGAGFANLMKETEAKLWESLADTSPTEVIHWAQLQLWYGTQEGGTSLGRRLDGHALGAVVEEQTKVKVAHAVMSLIGNVPSIESATSLVDAYDAGVALNRSTPRYYSVTSSRGDYQITVFDWDFRVLLWKCVHNATKQAVERWKKENPSLTEK